MNKLASCKLSGRSNGVAAAGARRQLTPGAWLAIQPTSPSVTGRTATGMPLPQSAPSREEAAVAAASWEENMSSARCWPGPAQEKTIASAALMARSSSQVAVDGRCDSSSAVAIGVVVARRRGVGGGVQAAAVDWRQSGGSGGQLNSSDWMAAAPGRSLCTHGRRCAQAGLLVACRHSKSVLARPVAGFLGCRSASPR